MKSIVEHRVILSAILGLAAGIAGVIQMPFPDDNVLLHLISLRTPYIFLGIEYTYLTMLFTTPFVVFSVLLSLLYIFVARTETVVELAKLPPYPEATARDSLYVVVGEVHHPKRAVPADNPRRLTIPDRGLYTGIAIFGAIGSGKTSGCMYPFAEQILAFRAHDKDRRIGGLVLEVKGDFCYKLKAMLERLGRPEDHVEVSLDSPFRYNPLRNDLDAYASAYGIASLLNNLFGKGKEPFWQQAYTNLVKFVILLHKILYDYVTLFDVYEGAINPDILAQRIKEGEAMFQPEQILISVADFMAARDLATYPFEPEQGTDRLRAPVTPELTAYLDERKIAYTLAVPGANGRSRCPASDEKRQQFDAVKRWFHHDWMRIEPKLRTSIVEGIAVFLSLFDDNPAVKRVFCPPKETYDPVANHDGRYGTPLPSFSELVETGAVCALNFPVSANPGLAKAIGTLMKQDFQRAMVGRIPRMACDTRAYWRDVLFLCDEYHSFATVGENDPSGDEKFFALSRQAKCIPIVATQSISSLRSVLFGEAWRTLLQSFRTKIFLSLSDDFSAKCASELCGKEEQLKLNYSFSEHGQDAAVSVLGGRSTAGRATVGTSKGYNLQRDFVFEPKIFSELKNAQAIVLAYDGLNPHPASYCYLKPYFLDKNRTYFEQLRRGEI